MFRMHTATLFRILSCACVAVFFIAPANAFTADSLDITIDTSGDAIARFSFTLEGFLEKSIPRSILEEELKKGLTTSSDPPVLLAMDRSGATLLLKKFAETRDVEQGTEYSTPVMDFTKAETALKESSLNSIMSADFSPAKITVTFPDAATKTFENAAILPALTHTVINPFKPTATATPARTGTVTINTSPFFVQVSIDGTYIADSPDTVSGIPAGTHTFLFQKEGFLPVTKNITVVAGRTTSVYAVLQNNVSPTKAPSGFLALPGFGLVTACLALGSCAIVRRIIR